MSRNFAGLGGPALLDLQQLDVEDQHRVRRYLDVAGSVAFDLVAVAQLRRDDESALAAHLHHGDAFQPALDHATLERKADRLPQ